ncbi:hypothetical protein DXG01_012967 [Tephrocybe rancida]|nr:hypothetical protein DXG01_012967 [Tephrocybe rancida]
MGKHDIYKLTESPTLNYDAWEFRTRITAKSKGLLETILSTDSEPPTGHNSKGWKAWEARQEAAAELLVKSLEDDQLIHVRGLESEPGRMWDRLRTVHEKTGVTGSATDLWSMYHTTTYDGSTPLCTHIGTIHAYAEALDRLHHDKPSNTQTITRIFTSLPPSYSTIIKILKNHRSAGDIEFIVERILMEETTQKAGQATIEGPGHHAAFSARARPRSTLTCVNSVCEEAGRKGHTIDNCFWPGGGKEGQWPEWLYKEKGAEEEKKTGTLPAVMFANVPLLGSDSVVSARNLAF